MKNILLNKFKESFISVLPITILVVLLGFTIAPLEYGLIVQFLISCIFVLVGMSLFSLGADTAMIPIGQNMGSYLSKNGKLWITLICSFVLGVLVTVAEPDLTVLAGYVPIDKTLFILFVSVGVGLFLMVGVLRVLFKIKLNIILAISYFLIFVLVCFLSNSIVPLSFDAGSVTTGAISVPFIMAFGLGLSAVRGSDNEDSGFGMVALSSIGPILVVMLLLFLSGVSDASVVSETVTSSTNNFGLIIMSFLNIMPETFLEVAIIIVPIGLFFGLFQIFALKLPKQQIIKILFGLLWTFLGISIFLVGVTVGFLPVGTVIGTILAKTPWLFILVCVVLGFVMMAVEPAVQVLNKQIEEITNGTIKSSVMFLCIAFGVAVALGLCAVRIITGISILWILIPMYVVSIILCFITPKIFTGIAFDSGGVATGAMSSTFAFPLIMGACQTVGANPLTQAFGCLGVIAAAPVVTILILGFIYKLSTNKTAKELAKQDVSKRVEILEFD